MGDCENEHDGDCDDVTLAEPVGDGDPGGDRVCDGSTDVLALTLAVSDGCVDCVDESEMDAVLLGVALSEVVGVEEAGSIVAVADAVFDGLPDAVTPLQEPYDC